MPPGVCMGENAFGARVERGRHDVKRHCTEQGAMEELDAENREDEDEKERDERNVPDAGKAVGLHHYPCPYAVDQPQRSERAQCAQCTARSSACRIGRGRGDPRGQQGEHVDPVPPGSRVTAKMPKARIWSISTVKATLKRISG